MKRKFDIWKTIKLGTYKSVDEILHQFDVNQNFGLGYGANLILRQTGLLISRTEMTIDLVKIPVGDLGTFSFEERHCENVFLRGVEIGLKICPDDVGHCLRFQYLDQPRDENLIVAMEPKIDSRGHKYIFTNSCYLDAKTLGNKLWLHTKNDDSGSSLFLGDKECLIFYL